MMEERAGKKEEVRKREKNAEAPHGMMIRTREAHRGRHWAQADAPERGRDG